MALAGTGSFLPNDPVPQDRIDDVLGRIDGAPAEVTRFLATVGRRLLQKSEVATRHYAIDPVSGKPTHTVASLGEEAARRALAAAGREPADVEYLLVSSPVFDCMTPPTSTLLQERLGIERCAELEIHSNCAGVGKMVQVAFDALRIGRCRVALVVYAQLSSAFLRAAYYNAAKMTREQGLLRYLLSDGAGALILEAGDGGHEVLGAHVESIGVGRSPGMSAGGGADDFARFATPVRDVFEAGTHHLGQDFAALQRDACTVLLDGVQRMLSDLAISPADVAHYIWSMPTRQLYDATLERIASTLETPPARQKFRAGRSGYCGGAAILVHLDEMARSGQIEPGELVVPYSMESSKWMSGGFVVRW